jgi:predicted AlkP superfamily pyrophosphatase or phosphodiesterase
VWLVLLEPVAWGAPSVKRPKAPQATERVLLIGIDAADWNIIHPLLEAGRMPNLARVLSHAASGPLLTIQPLTKSPVIWTTIATGKVPAKHGINDFLTGSIPTTSNQWLAKPVWDILGSAGHRVGVVGWWVTWPASPVNGILVSDYIGYARGIGEHMLTDRVYPAASSKLVDPLVTSPKSITNADLRPLLTTDPESLSLPTEGVNLLDEMRWIVAGDRTFTRVALTVWREQRPDFLALYLRGVDSMCHLFWSYQNPQQNAGSRAQLAPLFREVVPRYYVYTDSLLGELLRSADERTTIVICSDHGFKGGNGGMGVAAHREEGILILAGRGVLPNSLSGATVYDVTPTVLAMFGLPRANDMDGVVLSEALDPRVFPPITRTLATYETGKRTPGKGRAPVPSPVDEELKERLKSLGYIQGK